MFCANCGKELARSGLCPNCGAPVSGQSRRRINLLIILGALFAVVFAGVIATMVIVGGVAVPKTKPPQTRAAEIAAIQTIRRIQVAQAQYHAENHRYARSLAELQLTPTAGLLKLYRFRLEGGESSYEIHADPLSPGASFYSDQTLVIRQSRGPTAATSVSNPIP